jgi:hypothetical protein
MGLHANLFEGLRSPDSNQTVLVGVRRHYIQKTGRGSYRNVFGKERTMPQMKLFKMSESERNEKFVLLMNELSDLREKLGEP